MENQEGAGLLECCRQPLLQSGLSAAKPYGTRLLCNETPAETATTDYLSRRLTNCIGS
jgi:hypothetical protein